MDWDLFQRFGLKVIGAIAGVLILAWLFRSEPTTVGRRELHYSRRLKIVAVLTLVFAAACAYGGTLTTGSNALWAYGLAIVFDAGGLYLIAETFTRHVRYDESCLYDRSIWRRGERALAWQDLTGYDYSEVNQWHIFCAGPLKVRVSGLLAGQDEFLTFLERKIVETGFLVQ